MYFLFDDNLSTKNYNEICESDCFVAALTLEELENGDVPDFIDKTKLVDGKNARFCKADTYSDYICGTLSIPFKDNTHTRRSFGYYLDNKHLLFIDDNGFALSCIKKIADSKKLASITVGTFFAAFLETVIVNDMLNLENTESHITKLEISALSGTMENFNHKHIALRKEIMALSHYYSQLEDMGSELRENKNGLFNENEQSLFKLFIRRAARLRQETLMLQEYSMQVREVYQAQIDIHQNKIMRILTVVTTIFLPLTLVVGWYGMNFKYMPELNWKYGYVFVIAISVAIVWYSISICKKKRFW